MDKLFVRKDVYEELLEKGFGKRDLSKLTKKKITDKNGHSRTVYVRNGEQPAEMKQPKAQESLSDEKIAKYEEMLEKVKAGPDENALFVRGEMLNKQDAIKHLEMKLGRRNGVVSEQKLKMEDEKKQEGMKDHAAMTSKEMLDRKAVESFKKDASRMTDEGLKQKVKNLKDPKSLDARVYSNPEEIAKIFEQELEKRSKGNRLATGHLEDDEPQNTDITAEDEARFGKQALSGLSGKRTSSEETKKTESENITYEQAAKAVKEGKTVQWKDRNGEWNDVDPRTSELVMARDMGSKLRVKPDGNEKPTQDDMKENYLDARNEAGKDIAENNKIETLSEKIEFSPDEMKMIRDTAKEIGYKVGKDEGKLLNAINSKDKAMYSALTKKNQKVWDESGKNQKTFSQTDLLKEKIQSMNGDFGSDTKESSFKDKVEEWKSKGLDNRAAHAKVAIDEIIEQIRATPNTDEKKLEELRDLMTDVQLNGLNSKYIKDKLQEEKKSENSEKIKAKEEYMNEVSSWQKRGLPRDAAFAKVALDKIVEEIKNTPKDNVQKLEELDNAFRDVQLNNTRSKYIKNILDIE